MFANNQIRESKEQCTADNSPERKSLIAEKQKSSINNEISPTLKPSQFKTSATTSQDASINPNGALLKKSPQHSKPQNAKLAGHVRAKSLGVGDLQKMIPKKLNKRYASIVINPNTESTDMKNSSPKSPTKKKRIKLPRIPIINKEPDINSVYISKPTLTPMNRDKLYSKFSIGNSSNTLNGLLSPKMTLKLDMKSTKTNSIVSPATTRTKSTGRILQPIKTQRF